MLYEGLRPWGCAGVSPALMELLKSDSREFAKMFVGAELRVYSQTGGVRFTVF